MFRAFVEIPSLCVSVNLLVYVSACQHISHLSSPSNHRFKASFSIGLGQLKAVKLQIDRGNYGGSIIEKTIKKIIQNSNKQTNFLLDRLSSEKLTGVTSLSGK